jgi:uncharacterized heparinase superfamily protein
MKKIGLYVWTLVYLRPSQILYFLQRRILPRFQLIAQIDNARRRVGISMVPGISASSSTEDDSHFSFLGRSKRFEQGGVDWICRDMPKLWRYNLHYFDYLHKPRRSFRNKCFLITDWIQHNPPGTEDAWEPYTVSLRIVNWIKWFLLSDVDTVAEQREAHPQQVWVESLYQQAQWLEYNIEYHLLANHYLKNGVALLFAGLYFHGTDAERWLQKGLRILRDELKEQFLADGGHFERSPMYHSISVVDYLDVLNLTQNSSTAITREITREFASKVTTALDFLSGICLPDGEIPLFNDSAFGIAPAPSHIFGYAERVIGYKLPQRSTSLTIEAFSASGYYVCRKARDMVIIDCGPIGPDYQPGHAHCDTLSYELAIDGQRVVVDSGVFDYEPSEERAYARSTRAHNTVIVDGEEQSEIWGVFRVGRRARPIQAQIDRGGDEAVLFEGAHDGYRRLKGQPIHKRRISYDGHGSWIVTDELTGTGIHMMESVVHIHPDFTLVQSGDRIFSVERCGEVIATIEALSTCQAISESGCHFPEFGLSRKNPVLAFVCSRELPFQLSYRIRKAKGLSTEAQRHANPLPVTLLPSGGQRTGHQNL